MLKIESWNPKEFVYGWIKRDENEERSPANTFPIRRNVFEQLSKICTHELDERIRIVWKKKSRMWVHCTYVPSTHSLFAELFELTKIWILLSTQFVILKNQFFKGPHRLIIDENHKFSEKLFPNKFDFNQIKIETPPFLKKKLNNGQNFVISWLCHFLYWNSDKIH